MRHPQLMAACVLATLAACAGPNPNNGNWVGDVTPRTEGPTCQKTRGLAQIGGDRVTFSPNQGTWTLLGTATSDGRLTAERIGEGSNKLPYETRLEGRWTPQTITATYTTPRCVFDVKLNKP